MSHSYIYVENIRLTGGRFTIYEGQVDVFINGRWGTVCSDGIGTNEAETLCRSLGFGPFQSISNDTRGSIYTPLAISGLSCGGYYSHFMECTFNHLSPLCSSVNNLHLKCHRKDKLCIEKQISTIMYKINTSSIDMVLRIFNFWQIQATYIGSPIF